MGGMAMSVAVEPSTAWTVYTWPSTPVVRVSRSEELEVDKGNVTTWPCHFGKALIGYAHRRAEVLHCEQAGRSSSHCSGAC